MGIRFTLLSAAALAVALGWYQLFSFSATPGEQFAAPAHWPQDAAVTVRSQAALPHLLVFIHPRCSCTAATLEQLDHLLGATPTTPVQPTLVVYRSKALNLAANPNESDSSAFQPGHELHRPFQILPDANGQLARRFGAATSGEIVLYSADGRLLFQGGITPERSHVGPSAGQDALRHALDTNSPQTRPFSVFGCSIFHAAIHPAVIHSGDAG